MKIRQMLQLMPQCYGGKSLLKHKGFIFLFSHMRAYTSVLSHVIGSHPDITGYSEMHQKIRYYPELMWLSKRVQELNDKAVANRYVYNKILHDHQIGNRILDRKDVKALVMIREPLQTIESIIKIGAGGITTVDHAKQYYIQRLQSLRQLLERRDGNCCYLDGQALITDTSRSLSVLSEYLQLTPPLSEHYSIFSNTGKPKFGDPSKNIMSGKILSSKTSIIREPSLLNTLSEAIDYYQDTRAVMIRNCETSICLP